MAVKEKISGSEERFGGREVNSGLKKMKDKGKKRQKWVNAERYSSMWMRRESLSSNK